MQTGLNRNIRGSRARLRPLLASIVALGCAALVPQAAGAGTRAYFDPHAIYHCTAVVPTGLEYINSYQFKSHHRYAVGYQHDNRLAGRSVSGRYALQGNKIVGLSGPLKRHHESLLIQRSDLALLIDGRLSGVGCRRPQPPTSTPTPIPTTKPTIPTGYYSCKHTTQVVSGLGAGYYSTYAQDIELHGDLTYAPVGSVSPTSDNHWSQQDNTVTFTSGPLSHDRATWYPNGVAMPHGGTNVPSSYTLVIYDTVQEGATPPSVEYSTTDGPSGSASAPMSFNYCNLETPGS
jgi:hypothetical protein